MLSSICIEDNDGLYFPTDVARDGYSIGSRTVCGRHGVACRQYTVGMRWYTVNIQSVFSQYTVGVAWYTVSMDIHPPPKLNLSPILPCLFLTETLKRTPYAMMPCVSSVLGIINNSVQKFTLGSTCQVLIVDPGPKKGLRCFALFSECP